MEIEKIDQVFEALLFVAGAPVAIADIMDKLDLQKSEVVSSIKRLKQKFGGDSGIHILHFSDKVQLCSNPQYSELIAQVLNPIREKELSRASMETAAIIAYKQPITKLEVDEVRGVNSDYAIQSLLKQNMICIFGRKDVIGKPLLYATTDEFLKRFGLNSLEDLPDYEQLLERINVVTNSAEVEQSLYNEFEIPDEEEIPEHLKDVEDLERIE